MSDGAETFETRVAEAIRRCWGFDELRPLQGEAIRAGIEHRDSLLVMPTGGGKSLCYQVPPLVTGRTDIVVSPLISLMKDQVDALRANDYPAAALHSGLDHESKCLVRDGMADGRFRLVFVSPERLVSGDFQAWLERVGVRAFAIDEAHCISQWGHDFRPEYRQLATLRERFPEASLHACTATATPRVREDITEQLCLRDPAILVGSFDRPNLTYRVVQRIGLREQVLDILSRHKDEASIVYCITRDETVALADALKAAGIRAAAYHAGFDARHRASVHDAFSAEELDVVVATVAFGMGIDRSNVRCVIHAAMPKSLEAYQQETGRAGRDGLEAECVLLHSSADAIRWEGLVRKSAAEAHEPESVIEAQVKLLRKMQNYSGTLHCRHRALVTYFGQDYEGEDCGACDVCLGEVKGMDGGVDVARKILSCVYRTGQRFGVGHVVDVLRGSESEPVTRRGHHDLSTFGLLADQPKNAVMSFVFQLVDQGLLGRTADDRPILYLNDRSLEILRGERDVLLAEPRKPRGVRRSRADTASWEGVDRDLFEKLREWRYATARERGVPAYIVLADGSLRELARHRPQTLEALRAIHGIGEKKLEDLGEAILEVLSQEDGPTAEDRGEPRSEDQIGSSSVE